MADLHDSDTSLTTSLPPEPAPNPKMTSVGAGQRGCGAPAGIEPATPCLPFVLPRTCHRGRRGQVAGVSVADRGESAASCSEWHGDGTGGEDDPVSYLPEVAPARAMGEACPRRHQQHRWQAADGGAAAARRARYVPALRRRAVQGRSSWIDVPPYAARCRFARRLSVHSGRKRQGVARSLPLPIYSAPGACGKTRVVPHNLPAEARTCGNRLLEVRVLLSTCGARGMSNRRWDSRCGCALGAEV
jgi:hypothetical protein